MDILHDLVIRYNLKKIEHFLSTSQVNVSEAIFNEAVRMCAKKQETLLINLLLPYSNLDEIRVVECEIPWLTNFLLSKGVTFRKGFDSRGYKDKITYHGDVLTLHDCVYRPPRKYF